MLILIQREQEALAAFFEWAEIGPTSPGGWTAIWSEALPEALAEAVGRFVCIDDAEIRVMAHGRDRRFHVESADVVDLSEAMAEALDLPEAAHQMRAALEESTGPEELSELLSGLAEMPEMQPERPTREIILHRGDVTSARMVARIAGPARLTRLGQQWTAISEFPEDIDADTFASMVSHADSKRTITLPLWRRDESAGVTVVQHDDLLYSTEWNTGWLHVELPEDGAAAVQNLADKWGPRALRGV